MNAIVEQTQTQRYISEKKWCSGVCLLRGRAEIELVRMYFALVLRVVIATTMEIDSAK